MDISQNQHQHNEFLHMWKILLSAASFKKPYERNNNIKNYTEKYFRKRFIHSECITTYRLNRNFFLINKKKQQRQQNASQIYGNINYINLCICFCIACVRIYVITWQRHLWDIQYEKIGFVVVISEKQRKWKIFLGWFSRK